MTKRKFDIEVWTAGEVNTTLAEFIDELTDALETIPDEYRDTARINIEYESGYYSGDGYFTAKAWYEKPETDAEEAAREKNECRIAAAQKKATEDHERRTLEYLKKKYG